MTGRFVSKRCLLPCVIAFAAGVVWTLVWATGWSTTAFSDGPWWHVTMISAPASPNSNEARLDLDIINMGDLATPGTQAENLAEARAGESKHFARIVDRLPAGLTVTDVHAEGGGTEYGVKSEYEIEQALKRNLCSVSGQASSGEIVSCLYAAPVRPYEHIIIAISVEVESGAGRGVNEVSVFGAGAPSTVSRHALALEGPTNYGIQSYEMTPEEEGGQATTQAGKHPFQLTTSLMLNTSTERVKSALNETKLEITPAGLTKSLKFYLPPGLIGNPTPLPKCSAHVFLQSFTNGAPQCPNDTVVGVASPLIPSLGLGGIGFSFVPYATLYPVVNIEPSVGEPARFGFGTPIGPVLLDTSVRTGQGYGVVVTVPVVNSNSPFIGSMVSFWGVPASPSHDNSRGLECLQDIEPQLSGGHEPSCPVHEEQRPFLIMPTSCEGRLSSSSQAESWTASGLFTKEYVFGNVLGEPYELDGCDRLNFEPSISVAPDGQAASTPTGLSVDVHVAQDASLNPTGLAESALRETTVTLPAGVELNPASADGLTSCGMAQIGLEEPSEGSCEDSAKVGTAEIKTPLLPVSQPLIGSVYVAQQNANPFGSLLAMYIEVRDPVSGVIVKLAGEVKPDRNTGQLTATFKNTPPLAFEDAILHFFGGSRAPLGTPALCGAYTTTASFTPWSGNPPTPASSEFAITSGPGGSGCANPLPFAPALTAGTLNVQAGAFTPFTMTMSREDGNQNLAAVQLRMPPGLSGLLTGVKLCGEAQANTGSCGPESLIGETTISAGLGGNPYTVKGGRVYITGAYNGAPFGLSIVNPAKAGPFDLENTPAQHPACDCVVVRAKIEVDPTTAALTVISDGTGPHQIPEMIEGIPLQIKHVNVMIDRPGFTFNPTNCSPMKIQVQLTSSEGSTRQLHVPFQITDCAKLAFKPTFRAYTIARTSRRRGASLRVRLSYPKAPLGSQANIAKVKVELPKQLPARLDTLKKACRDVTFNADPAACPVASRVGTAQATTPLLPLPLNGPAYFVSHGGARFPELVIVLSGYGVTVDLHGETFIKRGVVSSTFNTVPDVPVGNFELNLPQGPYSALAANGSLCKKILRMPTFFTAQNGVIIKQATLIMVAGCARQHKRPKNKSKHT